MSNDNYNPDVLSCLANLSNDEVFTPPEIVNKMLDLLPVELWSNKEIKFLDPFTKSGVFLREIAKRLINGLSEQIPNLQERLNHIFHKQLYGIAITELTSLLSRRSLYCSKYPNCRFSVSKFDNTEGNIRFRKIRHTWKGNKCTFCGATKEQYNRDDDLESHAYEFIHTYHPERILNMKFDVIVGNPPYQIGTAGNENGNQAKPLYHTFVESAKKLNPKFITMIIPSRWFTGGWGLDSFRNQMISSNEIVELHDFPNAEDCFPGVQIKGGVCYFLWKKNADSKCKFVSHFKGNILENERYLKEAGIDSLIRFNESISVLHKVRAFKEKTMIDIVSSQKPFGLGTAFHGEEKPKGNILVFENKKTGYIKYNDIPKKSDIIHHYKVYISAAYGAGEDYPHQILNVPIFGPKESCCTETYLTIGDFKTESEARNCMGYIATKFFRFMVMLLKNSQHALKSVYALVPQQSFDEEWTDEKLYKKYNLSKEETDFIEKMIKPMDLGKSGEE